MSDFTPTPIDGAVKCEDCNGTGIATDIDGDEFDCPGCDGLGEWFD